MHVHCHTAVIAATLCLLSPDIPAAAGEAVLSSFDLMDHTENVTTGIYTFMHVARYTCDV